MRDHNKLTAFKLADDLVIHTYRVTAKFPKEELFGLTSQMRRAAASAPTNIVEGCARESQASYLNFLDIAYGSLKELHYQYTIAVRLDYIEQKEFENYELKLIETEKVLAALIRSLRGKRPPNP
jgi:four helix bundle protein